jgi:hypothetical protein
MVFLFEVKDASTLFINVDIEKRIEHFWGIN